MAGGFGKRLGAKTKKYTETTYKNRPTFYFRANFEKIRKSKL